MDLFLRAGSSPHIRDRATTRVLMRDVIIALLPTTAMGLYFFGAEALVVLVSTIVAAVLTEYLWCRLRHLPLTVGDYSAAVTGLLLGLSISSKVPWWQAVIGSVFAILIAKLVFGGLGQNFINPALAGRALLMASWPAQMTNWALAHDLPWQAHSLPKSDVMAGATPVVDALSSATPLAALKAGGQPTGYLDLLLGHHGGTIGEVSALALLLGLAYLLYRRVIHFDTPLAYIGSFAILTWLFGGPHLGQGDPLFGVLSGGLLLGACFMATDYTTTPLSSLGRVIFGVGCAILTVTIRRVGGYPEGVSYAILIMNCVTPLIDRLIVPRSFGMRKQAVQAKKAGESS